MRFSPKSVERYYWKELKNAKKRKAVLLTSLSAVELEIAQITLCLNKAKQGL